MISRTWFRTVAVLALMASLSLLIPHQSKACGPFFTDAIFVYSKHPDFPLERFAAGQIGVLRPGYARSYLVAAYRNLIGESLSAAEGEGINSLWNDRLGNETGIHDDEWIKGWLDARSKVPGVSKPPEIRAYRNREKPHEYESYLNCQEDAFQNAQTTLGERIKKFSADSVAVHEWVAAQDAVFANCGEGKQIPAAAQPDQDALIRADRAYQIAAANFYAGSLDEAKQQFDAIAHDQSSPWHEIAGYLAARALLRKGSFAEKEEEGRPALAESENRLKAIINNKSVASAHHAAARLLNLVSLRLHPEVKVHELAHAIVKKDASADFKQTVWDYTVLLDKLIGDDEETDATKRVLPAGLNSDELTDWILTFEDSSSTASSHSFDRWEKTRALPWMLVAITKASARQPKIDILMNAAAQVDHGSPAFPTLAYHTIRLLIEGKRIDEARSMVDKILASDRSKLPPSAVNLLLAQRLTLSRNLEELLQSSQRVPAGLSDDSDGRELPEEESQVKETTKEAQLFFDIDSANILNKGVPVSLLKDAAQRTILAANLREDVAQAAFVRAAILGERESANQAGTILATIEPGLKGFIDAYQRAATPEARQFAATFLLLKSPGLRPFVTAGIGRRTELAEIDSYRDNYWCAEPPTGESTDKPKAKPLELPEFLQATRPVAERQLAAVQALGPAPDYFCRTAIDWANKNPDDPRAPEALHLAVRSTRYGCTDEATGRWSRAAFDLLHRRYPNSPFAKATKYWFKG